MTIMGTMSVMPCMQAFISSFQRASLSARNSTNATAMVTSEPNTTSPLTSTMTMNTANGIIKPASSFLVFTESSGASSPSVRIQCIAFLQYSRPVACARSYAFFMAPMGLSTPSATSRAMATDTQP